VHETLELEQGQSRKQLGHDYPTTPGDGVDPAWFESHPGERGDLGLGQATRDAGRAGFGLCPAVRRDDIEEFWDIPQHARAVGEQTVGTPTLADAGWARHRPHVPPRIQSVAGCYQGAALLGCLDDDHGGCQAGDDPVPRRKPPGERRLTKVILGDERAMPPYGIEEGPIDPGIDDRVSIGVQTGSRSTPRTSRSPS